MLGPGLAVGPRLRSPPHSRSHREMASKHNDSLQGMEVQGTSHEGVRKAEQNKAAQERDILFAERSSK